MKLTDFYFADKNEAGTMMPILLPSGEDSGEWLQVMGPDCDAAIKAGREYTSAYRRLQDAMSDLDKACKEKEDWTEYNEQLHYRVEPLNRALAEELVIGWSFDDEFSQGAVRTLLSQYRGLSEAVVKHHTASRAELAKK